MLPGVFPCGIKHNDDLLGVLSLIFYSLTIITLIKYVFIVLAANDNGDGNFNPLHLMLNYHLIACFKAVNSTGELVQIASAPSIHRVPGLALFYTELVHGISPIFTHYVANVPALHSVLVFVSIKSLPISTVPLEDRFLFQRVEPHELGILLCVVRYGYKDPRTEWESFEQTLVNQLKEFIRKDALMSRLLERRGVSDELDDNKVAGIIEEMVQREVGIVDDAIKLGGVVYPMGESEVMTSKGSSLLKKIAINYGYVWLKRCVRQADKFFMIPRKRLLKVGMTYEI